MKKPRSQFDLNSLQHFLTSVDKFTDDLIYGPGTDKPVYHYTDLGGLQGILQRHDLWLTHSRYCNDDEEITHGLRVVTETIKRQIDAAGEGTERRHYLEKLSELVKEPTPEGVYICCFCLEDDKLSQWRGYGANGTGVSVRLTPNKFDYITGSDSPSGLMRLWAVFYERSRQDSLVNEAINFFADYQDCPAEERPRLAADALQFLIPTFKNEGFQEESECRLIFTPPPDYAVRPEFRVARGMLVPYYSLRKLAESVTQGGGPAPPEPPGAPPQRRLPIEHVRVGPCVNKTVNVESVRMLLNETGYDGVTVDSCAIPFRG
jgi:hypothetical protein